MDVETAPHARPASGRLAAVQVSRLSRKPGMHADGAGLYLQVTIGGASWVLRYTNNGRARYMGLGSLALYGLKEARGKALDARRLLDAGVDPIEARRKAKLKARLEAANQPPGCAG